MRAAANQCRWRGTARACPSPSRRSGLWRRPSPRGWTADALQAAMPPGSARNAVDCALFDLEAKRTGTSAAAMLGLPPLHPVETAYTLSLDAPEAMAEAASAAAFRPLLKVKLGGDGDPARIAAVRAAAPSARLIVDANQAWSADDFEPNIAACVAAGVELVEQPLPAGADAPLATLPRPIPVCADESVHTAADLDARRRPLRRGQHQARQGRRPDRGAGGACRGAPTRARRHGRLHGGHLARHGPCPSARPVGRLCRPRRAAAARPRPRAGPALSRAAWSIRPSRRSGAEPVSRRYSSTTARMARIRVKANRITNAVPA